MESLTGVAVFSVVIFIVSVLVSRLPFVLNRTGSHEGLHKMLALSAGIMLGVVFLMILPEAMEQSEDAGFSHAQISALILAGFLVVFFIDFFVNIKNGHEHTHEFTSYAALGGLTIHALFDGISVAAGFVAGEDVGVTILVAICVHKCAEVFSLSSTMALSQGEKQATRCMVAFSAVTPLAAFVSYFLISGEPTMTGPVMALSSGILLFVVLCDMLPEVYHHSESEKTKGRLAVFVIGIAVAVLVYFLVDVLTGGQGI